MPELRKDPIVGHWVIIANERARRPIDHAVAPEGGGRGRFCPFCPGQEQKTPPEILALRDAHSPANGPGWQLRVVPNKFPVLGIEGELERRGDGPYDRMNGVGAHEVLIESPDHDRRLGDLEPAAVERVLEAFRERIVDLKRDTRFKYVMVFKNHGIAAGATLEHGHSQLIALPVVPTIVLDEMAGAQRYFDFKERCVFCDIVAHDLADGRRVVAENADFVVLSPYAPKFPFETWLLPRRHLASFETTPRELLRPLAALLRTALRKLAKALDDPPYNFTLHTTPFGGPQDPPHYHWHIEIMPTLTRVAGFEWGSGFYINPTAPEDAAAFLRQLED
jgi:UDPglucose--hexose-1-phosphate uridylyltransferase